LSQDLDQLCIAPMGIQRGSIEMGVAQGWRRYVGDAGDVVSGERFGASASGEVVQQEYAFAVDAVCRRALALRR
jgi:transketolase